DGHLHGAGRRGLSPPPRHPAPREGPGGHLRRRRGPPLLLHRHRRRSAGPGDRRAGRAGLQERRRRGLHRRSARRPRRSASRGPDLRRGPQARAHGGRPDRLQPLQGQRPADAGLRRRRRREPPPRDSRRGARHFDPRRRRRVAGRYRQKRCQAARECEKAVIDDTLLEAEEKMERAIEHAKEEFAVIRTGRASSAMFNRITVDYYGAPTPLPQVASIAIPEPRMVLIKPFDTSQISDVENAIRNSDLGVNPSNEGTQLRLNLPPMTEERRREMIKVARSKGEDAKIAIRNIR